MLQSSLHLDRHLTKSENSNPKLENFKTQSTFTLAVSPPPAHARGRRLHTTICVCCTHLKSGLTLSSDSILGPLTSDLPAEGLNLSENDSWKTIMLLAYQSLGVVYGDLSISPLYVYTGTFAEDIEHSETNEEIFGALSFVFWTRTLVPLFKYVFVVLCADDNGEGGTFALYSFILLAC